MRAIYIITAICLFAALSCAPRSDSSYPFPDGDEASAYCHDTARPLAEVLDYVGEMFGVKIDRKKVPASRTVSFAAMRIHPWSLEATLESLLEPYRLEKLDTCYRVTAMGHHQLSPKEGGAMMQWLASKYNDLESWEARKAAIRADLKSNMGIDKVPEQFEGKVFMSQPREYQGYDVRNLGLEILPGVYCTANIYTPSNPGGKMPLVLNPNGHYEGGRMHHYIQTRCSMLARMGCVAVSYDMFAYGHEVMFNEKYHKTALAQPYNILCAERLLDWFLKREDIDTTRVGITGSSGGGSQSFFVTALDDRITLSMPIVMVSSASFGGCPCESGSGVHFSGGLTNNVELSALCAPRPMLLVSDGADWTKDFPEIDMPFIRRIYGFYGAVDKVRSVHFANEVHDYGPSKRQAAYRFLAEQWGIDLTGLTDADGLIDESLCTVEEEDLLKVWGPGYRDMPRDAIHTPAEFAALIGWEQKQIR